MTEIPASSRFVDNPHAPDFFADDITGFFVMNGNVRITLEAVRVSHVSSPGPLNRVVIGRLVMPLAAAESLARQLLDFIESRRAGTAVPSQATRTLQ